MHTGTKKKTGEQFGTERSHGCRRYWKGSGHFHFHHTASNHYPQKREEVQETSKARQGIQKGSPRAQGVRALALTAGPISADTADGAGRFSGGYSHLFTLLTNLADQGRATTCTSARTNCSNQPSVPPLTGIFLRSFLGCKEHCHSCTMIESGQLSRCMVYIELNMECESSCPSLGPPIGHHHADWQSMV